jgi:hypothetical protein
MYVCVYVYIYIYIYMYIYVWRPIYCLVLSSLDPELFVTLVLSTLIIKSHWFVCFDLSFIYLSFRNTGISAPFWLSLEWLLLLLLPLQPNRIPWRTGLEADRTSHAQQNCATEGGRDQIQFPCWSPKLTATSASICSVTLLPKGGFKSRILDAFNYIRSIARESYNTSFLY